MTNKYAVLFVDDDPDVLKGIRRMLLYKRDVADFYFVTNAKDAMDFMKDHIIDIIVSDMRMSGIDGGELLSFVQIHYPRTVRVILSGYSDDKMVLKTVSSAHRFIAKPCQQDELENLLSQSFEIRKMLDSDALLDIATSFSMLPTLPAVIHKLIRELRKPDVSISSLSNIISKDVALSANIIKLVNSSFFGLKHHVTSISQAVSLLGIKIIKSLVIYSHINDNSNILHTKNFSIVDFNRHSFTVAKTAQAIYNKISLKKKYSDDVFIAGTFHDIGLLILRTLPKDHVVAKMLFNNEHYVTIDSEYSIMNVSHAEIGAYLLSLWGFSDQVVNAVLKHHSTKLEESGEDALCILSLYIAESFLTASSNGANNEQLFDYIDFKYILSFDLVSQVAELYKEFMNNIESNKNGRE